MNFLRETQALPGWGPGSVQGRPWGAELLRPLASSLRATTPRLPHSPSGHLCCCWRPSPSRSPPAQGPAATWRNLWDSSWLEGWGRRPRPLLGRLGCRRSCSPRGQSWKTEMGSTGRQGEAEPGPPLLSQHCSFPPKCHHQIASVRPRPWRVVGRL